jgi:hypothetical protein
LSALVVCAAPSAAQDGDEFDRTPEDCVATASIDRTKVIDDNTILFYMRGKKIFRNYLPRRCPGLERHERFMYQSRSGRLCSVDTITVLEQWGAQLTPSFTCSLGAFQPITAEEAEDIRIDESEGGPGRNAIDVERAELPDDEAPADEAPAGEADAGADAADTPPPLEH